MKMESIPGNLKRVQEKIEDACRRSGRNPGEVSLMAVSKNHPAEAVEAAIHSGHTLFGENRVQEAVEKFSSIELEYTLHMIGHLQRNKVRDALSVASCVQSVDALRTARKISSSAGEEGVDILLQVNTSLEDTKSGVVTEDSLYRLMSECIELPRLKIRGLMTLAPFTEDESRVRTAFRNLKKYFDSIESRFELPNWNILSMGMSSDYEIAIEEGSTLVRIGTAIFGERVYQ